MEKSHREAEGVLDTPRTDALYKQMLNVIDTEPDGATARFPDIWNHARQLERELAEATALLREGKGGRMRYDYWVRVGDWLEGR